MKDNIEIYHDIWASLEDLAFDTHTPEFQAKLKEIRQEIEQAARVGAISGSQRACLILLLPSNQ